MMISRVGGQVRSDTELRHTGSEVNFFFFFKYGDGETGGEVMVRLMVRLLVVMVTQERVRMRDSGVAKCAPCRHDVRKIRIL